MTTNCEVTPAGGAAGSAKTGVPEMTGQSGIWAAGQSEELCPRHLARPRHLACTRPWTVGTYERVSALRRNSPTGRHLETRGPRPPLRGSEHDSVCVW